MTVENIPPSNKSLDASGGSVFRNLIGAAEGALIRAAASTQPLCGSLEISAKGVSMYKRDRVTKFLLGLLVIGVWGLLVRSIIQLPNTQAQSKSEKEQSSNTAQVLKARGLIIVDELGRERIFIGSPVPNPTEGERKKTGTGLTTTEPADFACFCI